MRDSSVLANKCLQMMAAKINNLKLIGLLSFINVLHINTIFFRYKRQKQS